jgi:tRNA-dihydrouridine synthase B
VVEVQRLLLDHLQDHYAFYGEYAGVRTARKHIGWYLRALPDAGLFRQRLNLLDDSALQWRAVSDYFDDLSRSMDRMPADLAAAPDHHKENPLETLT